MQKEFDRTQRVSHSLHKELAQLLSGAMRDPRVAHVNITGVEVSRDLSHAKIFFTLVDQGENIDPGDLLPVLEKASGFMRTELTKVLSMRAVPRLSFRFDESVYKGQKMETLLDRVKQADDRLNAMAATGSVGPSC